MSGQAEKNLNVWRRTERVWRRLRDLALRAVDLFDLSCRSVAVYELIDSRDG